MKNRRFGNLLATMAVVGGGICTAIQFALWAREGFERHDFLLIGSMGAVLVSIAGVLWFFLKPYRASAKSLSMSAFESCRHLMDDDTFRALTAFAEQMFQAILVRKEMEYGNDDILVHRCLRNFTLTRANVTTNESYDWETIRRPGRTAFPVVQFGGNISSLATIQAEAFESENGTRRSRSITVSKCTDRILDLMIQLEKRTTLNEVRYISYQDVWRNAMLPGWDFVAVPQPCYFSGGIKNLEIGLISDKSISYIFALSIDILSGVICDLDTIRVASPSGDSLRVSLQGVPPTLVVLLIFKREVRARRERQ